MSFQTLEAVAARTRVVRVNLLPADFDDARKGRRVRFALAGGVLVVAAACGAAALISVGHVSTAQDALDVEQARTVELQAAQTPYAEVPLVLSQLETAQKVTAEVTAYTVPWYSYVDQVAATAPQDLSMTSLVFSVVPPASGQGATIATDPLSTSGVGTLTVSGQTKTQTKVADWMDQVATINGVENPVLSDSKYDAGTGVVNFTASATLTDAVLLAQQ